MNKLESLFDYLRDCFYSISRPEHFDTAQKLEKKLIQYSSQLYILISVLSVIEIEPLLDEYLSIHYNRLLLVTKLSLISLFFFGWFLKGALWMLDKLTGYGWIPYSREITLEELDRHYRFYAEIFAGHELAPKAAVRTLLKKKLINSDLFSLSSRQS